MREHDTSLESYIRSIDKNNENLRQIIDKLKEDELVILKPSEENTLQGVLVIETTSLDQWEMVRGERTIGKRISYDETSRSLTSPTVDFYIERFKFVAFVPEYHRQRIDAIIKEYNAAHDPNEEFFKARRSLIVDKYKWENNTDRYRVICVTSRTAEQHNNGVKK